MLSNMSITEQLNNKLLVCTDGKVGHNLFLVRGIFRKCSLCGTRKLRLWTTMFKCRECNLLCHRKCASKLVGEVMVETEAPDAIPATEETDVTQYEMQETDVIPATGTMDVISSTDAMDVIPSTEPTDVIPSTETTGVIPATEAPIVIPAMEVTDVIPATGTLDTRPVAVTLGVIPATPDHQRLTEPLQQSEAPAIEEPIFGNVNMVVFIRQSMFVHIDYSELVARVRAAKYAERPNPVVNCIEHNYILWSKQIHILITKFEMDDGDSYYIITICFDSFSNGNHYNGKTIFIYSPSSLHKAGSETTL